MLSARTGACSRSASLLQGRADESQGTAADVGRIRRGSSQGHEAAGREHTTGQQCGADGYGIDSGRRKFLLELVDVSYSAAETRPQKSHRARVPWRAIARALAQ